MMPGSPESEFNTGEVKFGNGDTLVGNGDWEKSVDEHFNGRDITEERLQEIKDEFARQIAEMKKAKAEIGGEIIHGILPAYVKGRLMKAYPPERQQTDYDSVEIRTGEQNNGTIFDRFKNVFGR